MTDDDGYEVGRPGGGGGAPGRGKAPHPAEIVRLIQADHSLFEDRHGTVFRWNGQHWEEFTNSDLNALIYAVDAQHFVRNRRNEIEVRLRAKVHDVSVEWNDIPTHEVAVGNGVIDLNDLSMRPHVPEDFLDKVIPWDFDPDAKAPVWEQALIDWFGDDEGGSECIAALQEFAGYILMSHCRYKRALMLIGKSDTGKSQILDVFRNMVGATYTCVLPVNEMDNVVRRSVIVGKSLNIVTELPADALLGDTGFKAIVSGEEIFVDKKHEQPFMYAPTAKHVFATNNPPRIDDRTEATFGRLLVLPMMRVFSKAEQDRELPNRLREEMRGVLAWAMVGAQRLHRRGGQWPEVGRSDDWMTDYRKSTNDFVAFREERLIEDEGAAVPLQVLTVAFNKWQPGRGKWSVRQMGMRVREAGGKTRKVRHKRDENQHKSVPYMSLVGWRLSDREMPEVMAVRPGSADGVDEIDAVVPPVIPPGAGL